MPYDPDELEEQAEEASEIIGETFKAAVVSVDETTNHEFYGSEEFDKRDGLAVTVEVAMDDDENVKFTEFFSAPVSKQSWFAPNFKLGEFRDTYDSIIREGMEVKARIDGDGNWEIVL